MAMSKSEYLFINFLCSEKSGGKSLLFNPNPHGLFVLLKPHGLCAAAHI